MNTETKLYEESSTCQQWAQLLSGEVAPSSAQLRGNKTERLNMYLYCFLDVRSFPEKATDNGI